MGNEIRHVVVSRVIVLSFDSNILALLLISQTVSGLQQINDNLQVMALAKGINVVSISVTDLDIGKEFYGETLELGSPVYDLPEVGWIEFESGDMDGNIAIILAQEDWKPNNGTTIVFNTEDCYKAFETLRKKGVRCEEPEVFPGYVTIFNFYDPFGNRLQMCSDAPLQE